MRKEAERSAIKWETPQDASTKATPARYDVVVRVWRLGVDLIETGKPFVGGKLIYRAEIST